MATTRIVRDPETVYTLRYRSPDKATVEVSFKEREAASIGPTYINRLEAVEFFKRVFPFTIPTLDPQKSGHWPAGSVVMAWVDMLTELGCLDACAELSRLRDSDLIGWILRLEADSRNASGDCFTPDEFDARAKAFSRLQDTWQEGKRKDVLHSALTIGAKGALALAFGQGDYKDCITRIEEHCREMEETGEPVEGLFISPSDVAPPDERIARIETIEKVPADGEAEYGTQFEAVHRQVGEDEGLYVLRYSSQGCGAQEVIVRSDEVYKRGQEYLGAIDFFSHLYPDTAAPIESVWNYSSRAISEIVEAWMTLVEERGGLDNFRRLSRTCFPDVALQRLRRRVLKASPGDYLPNDDLIEAASCLEKLWNTWGGNPRPLLRKALLDALDKSGDKLGARFWMDVDLFLREATSKPTEALSRDTSFFDSIKEQVSLEDYLRDHCGVEFVSDGPGRLAACCPFHTERTPSFKVINSTEHNWQVWRCYGGCSGSDKDRGTVIDAVMKRESFDEAMDAARWLNEEYDLGLRIDTEAYKRFEKIRQDARARIDVGREELTKGDSTAAEDAKKHLARRGFSQKTADHFNLGVDTEMAKAGRLSIPIYDKENHPVSSDSRALFDRGFCRACGKPVTAAEVYGRYFKTKKAEHKGQTVDFDWRACPHCDAQDNEAGISWLLGQYPRYKFQARIDKSKLLYHQFGAQKALLQDSQRKTAELFGLFLVEGYADCWAAWQAGQSAVCSYNGSILSDWQARNAVEMALHSGAEAKPIILVPDMDATGILNVGKNIDKLRSVPTDTPLDIQVVMGIDELHYTYGTSTDKTCKDLGDVLQYLGEETTIRLLHDNRRSAGEWIIRGILDAKTADGTPFHAPLRQMELVGQVLQNAGEASLDHLIPLIAERWQLEPRKAERWFQSNHSRREQISQITHEMEEWAKTHGSKEARFALSHGYDVMELLLLERAQAEFGPKAFVDHEDIVKCGKRNHPSRQALSVLMETLPKVPVPDWVSDWVSVVWVLVCPPWDDEQDKKHYLGEEAIRVENWLGQYSVYIPVEKSPGSGQSSLSKLDILRQIYQGAPVYVIDPTQSADYSQWLTGVGGRGIYLAIDSIDRINPLDFSGAFTTALVQSGKADNAMALKIPFVVELLKTMFKASGYDILDPVMAKIFTNALLECYKRYGYERKDVQSQLGATPETMPTLGEVYLMLDRMRRASREPLFQSKITPLVAAMEDFVGEGMYAGLYDCRTNIEIEGDEPLVFRVGDVADSQLPCVMHMVLEFLRTTLLTPSQQKAGVRKVLYIAESQNLLQSEEATYFLGWIASTCHKYNIELMV